MSQKIQIGDLQIHPKVSEITCQTNKGNAHRFTMEHFGQITPITVVENAGQYFIIDGIQRWEVAKQLPEMFSTLDCKVIVIPDDKIAEQRILLNSTRKLGIREKCLMVESVLEVLGKKPGVKRELFDLENLEKEMTFSDKIKKDRFHFACHIVDLGCSPSTLRKMMFIYNSTDDQVNHLLDLIDLGRVSIDNAYNVLKSKERKIKESETLRLNHFGNGDLGKYELYSKSSEQMSEVEDGSITLVINSQPYYQLRKYRNQGENPFGQEDSVDEYIEKSMKYCREVRKKLKNNGVLATILGETYKCGYQGICTKFETALVKEGWRIIDANILKKINPKFTTHPFRFINGYEKLIVACPTNEEPVFNDIKKPSSKKGFKVTKCAKLVNGNSNYTMASPEADITNVFTMSVFNTKELKRIDKDFTHDAPAPEVIYEIFIKSYSMPGDTVLDNFVGSGTVGVALKLGRNVIGYDIDQVNIDFCKKRFELILNEKQEHLSIAA
jgi:DNA modification methylase